MTHYIFYALMAGINKMNKCKTALEIIRIEYARYGSSTIQSVRAYVES